MLTEFTSAKQFNTLDFVWQIQIQLLLTNPFLGLLRGCYWGRAWGRNFTRLIITIPLEKEKKKNQTTINQQPTTQLKKTKETISYALAYSQTY